MNEQTSEVLNEFEHSPTDNWSYSPPTSTFIRIEESTSRPIDFENKNKTNLSNTQNLTKHLSSEPNFQKSDYNKEGIQPEIYEGTPQIYKEQYSEDDVPKLALVFDNKNNAQPLPEKDNRYELKKTNVEDKKGKDLPQLFRKCLMEECVGKIEKEVDLLDIIESRYS